MEDVRPRPHGEELGKRDLTNWIMDINKLPVVRVGSADLRHIMDMVYRPQNIRASA
jgi:hypothetical protein